MIRLFQIAVFSFLLLCLPGCNSREEEPIWEKLKIRDLAPLREGKEPGGQVLKTINFSVHVFEMPAENISVLDDIRQMLSVRRLRFYDYEAFGANSFSVGFGRDRMWNRIADLLHAAGGKMQTVLLLLADGEANDLGVAGLPRRQDVFYVSVGGSMDGETIGPGRLGLRIKAEKILGIRGLCSVNFQPVFTSPIGSSIRQLGTRARSSEFLFRSAGFELKMGPGELLFLGPKEYKGDQITLGSLFFSIPEGRLFLSKSEGSSFYSKPERKPAIRVFLLVCTSITA